MASLALGVAGSAIGSAFGPLGASIGWTLGSALGNALFPQKIEGPRLDDLKLHNSSYGQVTPFLWGTMRVAGNVIEQQPELTEHSETSGGKGGPEVTNYTYTCSFGVRLCEGPIEGVTRIWANGRLIYDTTSTNPVGGDLPITIYFGDEEQLPDPTLETIHGVGNVPAYRGVAYVVFTDLLLTEFGNALPNLNFEVGTKAHQNSQIRILYENLATGFDFGDDDIDPFPVVDSWPLYSGVVRIGAAGTGGGFASSATTAVTTVQTYNATPDLEWQATDVDEPMFFPYPWAIDTGSGFTNYWPIGMYQLPDNLIPLWLSPFSFSSSASSSDPNVGGSDMIGDGAGGVVGVSWSHLLGVTPGETVIAVALSSNYRRILFFTAATTFSNTITKWYEAVVGEPTRSGTVDPPLSQSAIGTPGPINNDRSTCNSLEPGGRYLWVISAMNSGLGGKAQVYEIDPDTNNFALNAECGDLRLAPGTHTGTAFAMQDGYCGWAGGDNLIVMTRFPEGDTLKVPLSEIVADLSDRAGLDAAEYDVTELTDLVDGYLVTQQATARDMIQPLRDAYFFDAVERDDKVAFVKRGSTSVVTIPDDDLAAHEGEDVPPKVGIVRAQEVDLPAVVNINHVDPDADFQTGSQAARRQVTQSQSEVTLDLPINMTRSKAKAVADTQLYTAWVERNRYTFFTSRKYAKYEPTDVVTVGGRKVRIIEKNESVPGVIKFDAVEVLAQVFNQPGIAVPRLEFTTSPPVVVDVGNTTAYLLDLPLVSDADDQNGFYAAMAGIEGQGWPGANLMKSSDGGTTYASIGSTATPAVIGTASSTLGSFAGGNTFDEANVLTVVTTGGELVSVTEIAVLNGANLASIGDEVIQFKRAELVDDNTYELTGLLRGRLGTEWAIDGHGADERFALLPVLRVPGPFDELHLARDYKPVTFGKTLASATNQSFTNTGRSLKPYAPVLLGGGTDGSGNVELHWTRRTRIGGAWLPSIDVPLSETAEEYAVQIFNSDYSLCARTDFVSTTSYTYTAADQISDFGAEQETIFFSVGQIGYASLGTQARGTAPGAGSTNDDPIVAIAPLE